MASVASRGVALIPLTITYGVDRSDVTIPQSVPLVELLPGLVESVGAFSDEPTNDGFAVRTASGRLLDQSKSLANQGVRAGAALTLEPLGEGASDMVYDDLTEAVGQVIERVSTPWTREDTRTLAALCAAALIFVAALLLATTPPDTIASLDKDALRTQNYLYGAIGLVSAMLVTGTSVVVARKSPGPSGIALAHTVPLLTAAAALRLTQSQWDKGGWISVGVGLLIGSLAALALPKRYRISIAAPVLLGSVIAATGLMVHVGNLSQRGVSAVLFAFVVVLLQLAPWVALAHIPVRILDANTTEQIPAQGVTDQVGTSFVFVVALRAGGDLPNGVDALGPRQGVRVPPPHARAARRRLTHPPDPLDSGTRGGSARSSHGPDNDPGCRSSRDPDRRDGPAVGDARGGCRRACPRRHERRRASHATPPGAPRGYALGALALCPHPSGRLPVGLSHAVE